MPKLRLTDLSVNALKPPESGTATYWDTLSPIGCRVSHGGNKSFIVMVGRERRRIGLGTYPEVSLRQAREAADKLLAERKLGISPTVQASPRFNELVAIYLDQCEHELRRSTVYEKRRILKKHFGTITLPIAEYTTDHVLRALDPMRRTPSEARHVYIAIRAFLSWCVSRRLIKHSPCEGLTPPSKASTRSRVLTEDELQRIVAMPTTTLFRCIVQLLLFTGQRRNEIASLRSEWIGADAITFPPAITKNKREHVLPITPMIAALIADRPSVGLLFPARDRETPYNGWSKAKAQFDVDCGVTDWTLHDLRRTYATGLAKLGTAPHIIEAILNHASGEISGVAAIYNRHRYLAEMRVAMRNYEEFLTKFFGQMADNALIPTETSAT